MPALFDIYALKEPTGEIRYIGFSRNACYRLHQHINEAKHDKISSTKANWIRNLLASGQRPILEIIEKTDDPFGREQYWISWYRAVAALTNTGNGNGALDAVRYAETRRKMSLARMGKHLSQQVKAQISLATLARFKDPALCALNSQYARMITKEARTILNQRLSASVRRRIQSGELLPQLAKAREKLNTPEVRAKMSAAHKGRTWSPEVRAKISASRFKYLKAMELRNA